MTIQSDEDKLIEALKAHKALKQWTMNKLQADGIDCTETYGNDRRGDIRLSDKEKIQQAQNLLTDVNARFNRDSRPQTLKVREVDEPHIEIKTVYIYGNEVDKVIEKKTIVGLVSASSISKTGKQKLNASGIACTENVPKSEFMREE